MADYDDTVKRYNDCYFISTNRKLLKEKAVEIKESWVQEAKDNLAKVESIKI